MSDDQLPNIFPVLRYRDAGKALEWLHAAFGFEQITAVPGPDGTIVHAEMRLGAGIVMFGSGDLPAESAPDAASAPQSIYVWVEDADAHHARARAAGAEITAEPRAMDYGSREYSARDLDGHHWSFGTYLPRADT